jgi:hypothetical protein
MRPNYIPTPASFQYPVQGGGIMHNIPPKKNTLPTDGPGKSCFTYGTPGHNTYLGFEGVRYNDDDVTLRQQSDYILSSTPPLSGQFNNATLPQAPALKAVPLGGPVVPLSRFTRIHPPEKTVLHTSGRIVPIVKRVGGPSPTTDTPFHPAPPQPAPVHRTRPTVTDVARFKFGQGHSPSFFQQGSGRGSGSMTGSAHHDVVQARWATVKRGAAG